MATTAPPHYHGHRQRLRERFLKGGADALADYELLELVLFTALPRSDVKPLAKRLLDRFGGFAAVMAAETDALRRIDGMGESGVAAIKAVAAAACRMAREAAMDKPVLGSWDKLLDYCRIAMAHGPVEELRLLFLDRKNRLIADEVQQRGTIDQTPLYPREVVRRALDLGASALILVHNHPSGDPTPSRADIAMTKEVVAAAGAVGIAVHDHLVIARGGHASFRSLGLL